MSDKILTVAVTYWRPVTEVFTIRVSEGFDLEHQIATQDEEGKMYQTLEVEGVKIMEPERGSKQDFEYEKKSEHPIDSVPQEDFDKGHVPAHTIEG